MSATQRCCLVLWGEQCDEVVAALFITNLRAAGVRVWVVGISGKRIAGAHGLSLVADIALDQAMPLAPQTVAVIIPCLNDQWLHFLNDPRLVTFLNDCLRNQARILMAVGSLPPLSSLQRVDAAFLANAAEFYPPTETLLPALQTLAATLR